MNRPAPCEKGVTSRIELLGAWQVRQARAQDQIAKPTALVSRDDCFGKPRRSGREVDASKSFAVDPRKRKGGRIGDADVLHDHHLSPHLAEGGGFSTRCHDDPRWRQRQAMAPFGVAEPGVDLNFAGAGQNDAKARPHGRCAVSQKDRDEIARSHARLAETQSERRGATADLRKGCGSQEGMHRRAISVAAHESEEIGSARRRMRQDR